MMKLMKIIAKKYVLFIIPMENSLMHNSITEQAEAECGLTNAWVKSQNFQNPELLKLPVILFGIVGSYLFLHIWENILLNWENKS